MPQPTTPPPEMVVDQFSHLTDEERDNEFERDRIIDKYALDVEWLDQQRRYKKWSDAWADAFAMAEKAEEYVKFMESKLDNDVREFWDEDHPGKKMTEAGIKAAVRSNEDYRQAVADHIEAKRIANQLLGAMRSFDQRKTALERLTDLDARQYFARPSIARPVREVVEEKQAVNRTKTEMEKLNKKRKPL